MNTSVIVGDDAARDGSYDGSGVTVGILSDSFDAASTIDRSGERDDAASDIAAGLLPQDTRVLVDHRKGSDEGRAMAQIVHRTAPGAAILFDTGAGGQAVMAQHILDLAAAGANVIVDDIGYPNEPDYQDGVVAQAIDRVVAQGVTYLSAAGNNGDAGYEGAFDAGGHFRADGTRYTAQRFSPDGGALAETLLPISGQAGQKATIQLAWSQPAASASPGRGATGDLDLFLVDARGHVIDRTAAVRDNLAKDPVEVLNIRLPDTGTYYLRVGLRDGTQAPDALRIVAISEGRPLTIGPVSSATGNSTLIGHKGAAGDIAVGAVRLLPATPSGSDRWAAEPFSPTGTISRLFDDAGDPVPAPTASGVDISGVDGVPTSFFAPGGRVDADGDPLFFGTSAAVAQVAAVAALMVQAAPSAAPSEIRRVLDDTARPVDSSLGAAPAGRAAKVVQAGPALDEMLQLDRGTDAAAPHSGSGASSSAGPSPDPSDGLEWLLQGERGFVPQFGDHAPTTGGETHATPDRPDHRLDIHGPFPRPHAFDHAFS